MFPANKKIQRCINVVLIGVLALTLVSCSRGAGRDSEGNPVAAAFSKSFGGPGVEFAVAGNAQTDGGYAFAGNLTERVVESLHSADGYVGRLDANGNLIWQTAIGIRNPSIAFRTGDYAVGYGSNEQFCIAAEVDVRDPSDRSRSIAQDAYAARMGADGALLWETSFDSEGWAGYSYAVVGGGRGEAAEKGVTAIGDGNGGCYVVYQSTADLLDGSGIGFDGREANSTLMDGSSIVFGDTFVGAESLLVARVDAGGNVLWKRRIVNGAFSGRGIDHSRMRPEVVATVQGVLVQYFFDNNSESSSDNDWRSTIAHFDRSGRVQFLREFESGGEPDRSIGRTPGIAIAQTDDLINGNRDGQSDDGFVVAYRTRVAKLSLSGQVQWQQEQMSHSAAGVFQQCFGNRCYIHLIGTRHLENPGFNGRGQIRLLDADTGVRILPGGVDDPQSRAYYDVQRTSGDTLRILGDQPDGQLSILSLTILPPQNGGDPLYQLDSRDPFSDFAVSTSQRAKSRFRLFPNGAFLFEERVIDVASSVSGVSRLDGRAFRDIEFISGMTTTEAGNHVVVGSSFGDGYGGYAVALDDDGDILWQHRLADAGRIDSVVARPGGGVVVSANRTDRTAQAVALGEDGLVLWESAEIDPDLFSLELARVVPPSPDRDFMSDNFRVQGRSLAKTSAGYLLGSGRLGADSLSGRSALAELDADGNVLWLRAYNIQPSSIAVLGDGTIKAVAEAGNGFIIATLNQNGQVSDSFQYSLLNGTVTQLPQISDAGGGAVNVTLTTSGLVSSGILAGNSPAPIGGKNVAVVRIDAAGNAEWARIHGGLANEFSESSTAMSDGGLLMSGSSDSLGDRREMWLLRLGADGLVNEGCNAYIGEISGALFSRVASSVADAELPIPANSPPAQFTDPGFTTFAVELVEARQCLGQSTSATPVAPTGGRLPLTVNQAGSVNGLVVSTPGAIFCGGNPTSVCSGDFPPDSLVTLTVDDADASRFRGWGDGCAETRQNPARCIVQMNGERTLDVFFEPNDGSTALLTANLIGLGRIFSPDAPWINCASDSTGNDCSETFPLGRASSPGYRRSAWRHVSGLGRRLCGVGSCRHYSSNR